MISGKRVRARFSLQIGRYFETRGSSSFSTQCLGQRFFSKLQNDSNMDSNQLKGQLETWKAKYLGREWITNDEFVSGHQALSLNITLNSILYPNSDDCIEDGKSQFKKGKFLPFGYFMIYATPLSRSQELGLDGFDNYVAPIVSSPQGNGLFLEPFKRRMWVSGEINYINSSSLTSPNLEFGKELVLSERIIDMDLKKNRKRLPNYKMRYERIFSQLGIPLVQELRTFYYIENTYSDTKQSNHLLYTPLQQQHTDSDSIEVKITQEDNFRVSALTFNAHKIHYDKQYAMEIEKYPNIVVSAPLLILMSTKYLVDKLKQEITNTNDITIRSIRYNILYPVFIEEKVKICYTKISETNTYLWIEKDNEDETDKLICFEAIVDIQD